MKKKWIALVVAIVTLTVSNSALALAAPASTPTPTPTPTPVSTASQPSKTTEDLTRVIKTETESGKAGSAIIWVERKPFELAKTQLKEIKSFLANKKVIADYFSDEVRTGMSALLPTGTDLSKLKMSEYVALGIGEYDTTMGDVSATFQFPTAFGTNKTVIAMVGYPASDGTIIWQALQTTVVRGNLQIVFPSELMAKVGHDAILAVLSN